MRRETEGAGERSRASLSWGRQTGEGEAEADRKRWEGEWFERAESGRGFLVAGPACGGTFAGDAACRRDCAVGRACRSWRRRRRSGDFRRASWRRFERDFEGFVVATRTKPTRRRCRRRRGVAERPAGESRFRSPSGRARPEVGLAGSEAGACGEKEEGEAGCSLLRKADPVGSLETKLRREEVNFAAK